MVDNILAGALGLSLGAKQAYLQPLPPLNPSMPSNMPSLVSEAFQGSVNQMNAVSGSNHLDHVV